MPDTGNGARFAQSRESLARFFIGRERVRKAALAQMDPSKLTFSDGNRPVVTTLLRAADALLVGGRGFVEPTQIEQTDASF